MKRIFPLAVFIFCLFLSSDAQIQIGKKGWQLKRIGVSFGQDQDRISNMNHTDFFSAIRGGEGDMYESIQYASDDITSTSMICENPNIRIRASLIHPKLKNTEIHLAANIIWDRIDAMVHDYKYENGISSYFAVDAYSNELALEGAFLKKIALGSFTFYGGAGANVGKTFGSLVCVDGHNVYMSPDIQSGVETMEGKDPVNNTIFYDYLSGCHEARSANHIRGFLQAGLGLTILKRVELDWQFRYGIGAKYTPNVGTNKTNLISSAIGINYVLKS